ncbi:MAG: threonine synthase [Candidatus Aenigmatarchaeota archaeon]|nr:MAG: threonine synthase [Candidatus Aenigmarchaeota archaeon]
MFEKSLLCYRCGSRYPTSELMFRCPECGSSLEVEFDYPRLKRRMRACKDRPPGHMRYAELYPVKKPVTAGEGNTPLIRSKALERKLGLEFELWLKMEYQNPTGSFKDRGSSIEVAKALRFMDSGKQKKRRAVCASTGNMGASVAAYSGIAGVPCTIFTPADASAVKLEQILAHGADVYRIKGDYAAAAKMVESAYKEYGLYLLGDYLYRREGTKSVGFEIMDQLPGADYVVEPIGNGTLLSATWKGMKELRTMGFARKLPRLAGIQASGCSPVARAFMKGSAIRADKDPHTVAVAMECGDPLDGQRAYDAMKESRGFSASVTDKQILSAREILARRGGIFTEPAGAASLAGVIKSAEHIESGSRVVCVVTGHGLKTPYVGVEGSPKDIGRGRRTLARFF